MARKFFPALLEPGYGFLGANLRSVKNDMDCVLEKLLLDIARHTRWLREERGVEKTVLLGNSGAARSFRSTSRRRLRRRAIG